MTIPIVPKVQSWTPGLSYCDDGSNALVFKVERSSDLQSKWGRRIMFNAIKRRLHQSIQTVAYTVEKGVIKFIVLESETDVKKLVYEVLRVRKWGLTSSEIEREISNIRMEMMQEAAVFQLDKHYQLIVLQTKFLNHFLYNDKITTPDSDVKLIEDTNSLQDLVRDSLRLLEIAQSRIFIIEPSFKSVESLIEEVNQQHLVPWEDTKELIFDELWKCENQISLSSKHLKDTSMHEYILSNGMRVLLCKSDLPYECSMKGFAYGGLSQQGESKYLSAYFALDLVQELPSFALKYNLAGRGEFEMNLEVEDYTRSFEAFFNTSQLPIALQLVYLLFCEKPKANEARDPYFLEQVFQSLINKKRLESHKFYKAYEYSSEPCLLHKVPKNEDIFEVDVDKALEFFSYCFLDPSQFTVVISGNFKVESTAESVQKYLGSIPLDRSELKTFPINFPEKLVRHDIYYDQSLKEVFVCVPLKMDKEKQDEDKATIEYLGKMVVRRLNALLRCELGEVYSVSAYAFFDGKAYASPESEEVVLLVRFHYDAQGFIDWELAQKAVNEIEDLRNAPSEADVSSLPSYAEPTQLCSSTVLSSTVLEEAVNAYQAKQYKVDLEKTILERRMMSQKMLASRDSLSWKAIFGRIMPYKCTERCVCVVFHSSGRNSMDKYSNDDASDDDSDEDDSDDDSDEGGSGEDSDEEIDYEMVDMW